MKKILPNFKSTYIFVGVSFVLLSLGLFVKGLMPSMAEFLVPAPILASPHYYDAILWVYVHMIVIGILILLIGISVADLNKQKWITVILLLITLFYTYLDFRSSDSGLGNGLYKGDSSVAPAIISLVVNLLFLQLAIKLFAKGKSN
jgi:hypothetical protein